MVRLYKDWEDITIYTACIGYENRPEEIFRAHDAWVPHIDGMIMGDGKFDFFPSENEMSTTGWLDAAEKRYKPQLDFIPYQYSGRQVDKRQLYLDIAGNNNVDILIVLDSEEYVDPKRADWDMFYRNLLWATTITNDKVFYQWVWIPSEKLWSKQGNKLRSNKWHASAKIHKKPGTMRYAMHKHFVWANKNVTDEKMIKWQLDHRGEGNPYQLSPHICIDGVRVRLDRQLRSKEFNDNQAIWAKLNQHAEDSREFYLISKVKGTPPPQGCKSWEEWENKPHTFDLETGVRIEL